MRMKSEILKFIAFIVNLIIAVGVAVLAGAYYVSRKVANCKAADAKEKPPAFASEARTLGATKRCEGVVLYADLLSFKLNIYLFDEA
jgi:hypothetical protein